MDKTQTFIKDYLFSRNFDDPNKPFDDKRFNEKLLIIPTDGGLFIKLRKKKKQNKLSVEKIENSKIFHKENHENYKQINKNSKKSLKEYINTCEKTNLQIKKIIKDEKIQDRLELETYLKKTHVELYNNLPNYEKIKPMYEELWVNYIKEILNIPQEIPNIDKFQISGGNNSLVKLSMADFNGCKIHVTKSKNKNLINMEGIILWDAQKSFIIITKGKMMDEIKCIPKKGTIFKFEIPIKEDYYLQYTILGDRFKYRSSDRAGRKFKSRRCDDMLYYVQN
ncbi:hypothetical protein TBLA_0D05110 [Henningerozyma blattae CBS 6284]|uniref:Ribonuclease P protein subunit n=1 Tax=Henningerozyma blattae (strain ATCC 34711 / CBS 6284 / DSM 70876 / NBRC 10599 / NRRL Y-10934 / UCD 77-7) TaxID=1071380 RepID=I2H3Q3_HENB6|nr:hypothetical protein TBLA_0D05110 [Tetrapisispora blattae CBS 6284]CCH61005.1 hypothetical protein TBLA_0D05110 [Tetrapisispora blattae CBS 6284]